jgi:hypothetical protein
VDNADHHVNQVDQMLPFGSPKENVWEARERHLRRYLEAQRDRENAEAEDRLIRESRRRRRSYLALGLLVQFVSLLIIGRSVPENLDQSDSPSSWWSLLPLVVTISTLILGRVKGATAWPERHRDVDAKALQEAWAPYRQRGERIGYKVAVFTALIVFLFSGFAAIDSAPGPLERFFDSPRNLFVLAAIALFVIIDVPIVYVGWFGLDKMPGQDASVSDSNAIRPDAI